MSLCSDDSEYKSLLISEEPHFYRLQHALKRLRPNKNGICVDNACLQQHPSREGLQSWRQPAAGATHWRWHLMPAAIADALCCLSRVMTATSDNDGMLRPLFCLQASSPRLAQHAKLLHHSRAVMRDASRAFGASRRHRHGVCRAEKQIISAAAAASLVDLDGTHSHRLESPSIMPSPPLCVRHSELLSLIVALLIISPLLQTRPSATSTHSQATPTGSSLASSSSADTPSLTLATASECYRLKCSECVGMQCP